MAGSTVLPGGAASRPRPGGDPPDPPRTTDELVAALADPAGAAPSLMVDDVYRALLAAIDEGRLPAGTPLSQNKLAAHMGVSRTPVREALLRLERDGLVRRVPDLGFAVASITAQEVHDACDLLEVLDAYVYVRAAGAMEPSVLGELRALAEELVAHADSDDVEAWRRADARYHALVMDAAGNRLLADHLQQVRRRVQRFGLKQGPGNQRLVTCSQDHVALADAMADADEAEIAATVATHIERLRSSVLQRLEAAAPLLPTANPLAAVGL